MLILAVIIADSTCDLTLEHLEALNVEMMSLKVYFGEKGYLDKREITNEQFFEMLAKCKELPTTSLVSMSEFMDAFSAHPEEDIVVVTISSKLSGTNQAAVLAKEELGRDNIYVIDSLAATSGTGLLVLLAAKLRDEGKTGKEIADILNERKTKLRLFATISSLDNLVKGGRLSGFSGAIGNILSIKPLIAVKDGLVTNVGKARGQKAAVEMVAGLVEKANPDLDNVVIYIHSGDEDYLGRLKKHLPKFRGEKHTCHIGSVVGTHVGSGAVGIAFFAGD